MIYKESLKTSDILFFKQEVKKELVQYFKNKQRVLPAELKNPLIYNDITKFLLGRIMCQSTPSVDQRQKM